MLTGAKKAKKAKKAMKPTPCMICGGDGDRFECGKQPNDREDTEFWVYCKKCDTWTEYPISVLD